MASEAWKWEKLDKIREAVGLGRPLSLSSTFVGGGDGKRGINGLKTPLSDKKSTHTMQGKRTLFIWFTVDPNLG